MKMIEENQECRRCLEDYTMCSSECEAEINLCGGCQKGEGCGEVNQLHAFICRDLRTLMWRKMGGEGGRTFLQVMWVKACKRSQRLAGLIDPGATGYFVNH